MPERSCHRQPFRLGPWTVEPEESAIRGAHAPTRVDHKAMHVLCFLADNAGQTVSREAIFDHVWPDTVVTDDVLTVAISTLRRALGDDAKAPTFIRTLPKLGYRLLVSPAPVKEAALPAGRAPRTALRVAVAAGLLLLAAIGLRAVTRGPDRGSSSIESVAVLPFKNYSENADLQYLADGITEAITTQLAQTEGVEVTSRTTAQRYDEAGYSVPEIGRRLDVETVLEGSVQVTGNQLRLHAQLIDVATDRHVWAEDYDRSLDDLLQVQNDLAVAVAGRVGGRPVGPPKRTAVDARAYDLYLKARYLQREETPASLAEALQSLERSIEFDAGFAEAHAALAEVLYLQTELGLLPPDQGFPRGGAAAERALALDPDLPAAHAARGIAAFSADWDFETAGRSFERAVNGNAPDLFALKWYVRYLVVVGRAAEAVERARAIHEIDPQSYVNLTHVMALSYAGQNRAALDRLREIESLLPVSPATHVTYTLVYLQMGRHDEAARSILKFAELAPWPEPRLAEIRDAFRLEGPDGVYRYLAADDSPVASSALRAKFHATLGHDDEALRLLEESIASRDMNVLWINADRCFDRLRSSTRFRRLVRQLGLPELQDG